MAKRSYLICYDISNSKRLRRVCNLVSSYGYRLQYSVFECSLSALQKEKLKGALINEIKHDSDQVIFVDLGKTESKFNSGIEAIGQPYLNRTLLTIV